MVLTGVYTYHQFDNWIASAGELDTIDTWQQNMYISLIKLKNNFIMILLNKSFLAVQDSSIGDIVTH